MAKEIIEKKDWKTAPSYICVDCGRLMLNARGETAEVNSIVNVTDIYWYCNKCHRQILASTNFFHYRDDLDIPYIVI